MAGYDPKRPRPAASADAPVDALIGTPVSDEVLSDTEVVSDTAETGLDDVAVPEELDMTAPEEDEVVSEELDLALSEDDVAVPEELAGVSDEVESTVAGAESEASETSASAKASNSVTTPPPTSVGADRPTVPVASAPAEGKANRAVLGAVAAAVLAVVIVLALRQRRRK